MSGPYRPEDARRLFGGDARRAIWSPTDTARAEAMVAEFGGVLSLSTGQASGVCVEWLDESGYRVALEGVDASAVLGGLSAMLRDRRTTDAEASFFPSFLT